MPCLSPLLIGPTATTQRHECASLEVGSDDTQLKARANMRRRTGQAVPLDQVMTTKRGTTARSDEGTMVAHTTLSKSGDLWTKEGHSLGR